MRKILAIAVFMLATLAWAVAQQPGGMPDRSGGQATSPSPQSPGATQNPGTTQNPGATQSPGSAGREAPQAGAQAGSDNQAAVAPITEGCLGGSNPNFTITDKVGKTYKLNIPAGSDASPLNAHVGESVQVLGQINAGNQSSIDVSKIGRGSGNCPGSSNSTGAPSSSNPTGTQVPKK